MSDTTNPDSLLLVILDYAADMSKGRRTTLVTHVEAAIAADRKAQRAAAVREAAGSLSAGGCLSRTALFNLADRIEAEDAE